MHCAHACFPAPARAIRTAHFSHKKCVARFGYCAQVSIITGERLRLRAADFVSLGGISE